MMNTCSPWIVEGKAHLKLQTAHETEQVVPLALCIMHRF